MKHIHQNKQENSSVFGWNLPASFRPRMTHAEPSLSPKCVPVCILCLLSTFLTTIYIFSPKKDYSFHPKVWSAGWWLKEQMQRGCLIDCHVKAAGVTQNPVLPVWIQNRAHRYALVFDCQKKKISWGGTTPALFPDRFDECLRRSSLVVNFLWRWLMNVGSRACPASTRAAKVLICGGDGVDTGRELRDVCALQRKKRKPTFGYCCMCVDAFSRFCIWIIHCRCV